MERTNLHLPIILLLLVDFPTCFSQSILQEYTALNSGNCHLRIISWPNGWQKISADDLHSVHSSTNTVVSIQIYPSVRTSAFALANVKPNGLGLYLHPSLSSVYYFITNVSETPLSQVYNQFLYETGKTVNAFQTVYLYIFRTELYSPRASFCMNLSFFEVNKWFSMIAKDFACVYIDMSGSIKAYSKAVSVLTDIPKRHFKTGDKICRIRSLRSAEPATVRSKLNVCVLTIIGNSYNLTYNATKLMQLTASHFGNPLISTKLLLRTSSTILVGAMNLQIVESPFLYEPFAFTTIKTDMVGLENAITCIIDFTIWAFVILVFVCMRVSITACIVAVEAHYKLSNKSSLKHILIIFITARNYKKLASHASKWMVSRCILVNELIWALGLSTILSYACNAGLTAFLTHTPEPIYPHDLETLVSHCMNHENCVVTSTTTYGASRLISDISPALKTVIEQYTNGINIFTEFIKAQIKSSHKSDSDILSLNFPPSAMLDTVKSVELCRHSMRLFMPEKNVSPSRLVNFKSFLPFYVNKSPFYRIIKKALNSVHESGIYDHWQRYFETKSTLYRLSATHKELKAFIPETRLVNLKGNWLMYLLGGRCKTHCSEGTGNQITFLNLSLVWTVYPALLASVCIVLFFEIYDNNMYII